MRAILAALVLTMMAFAAPSHAECRVATPQILEAYYDSYVAQGQSPPAAAQNALMRAHTLLPKSPDLRYKLAADFEQRGMIPEAIAVIAPEAFETAQSDEDEAEKERRDRDRFDAKIAGHAVRKTPRDMLLQLQRKRAAASGAQAP